MNSEHRRLLTYGQVQTAPVESLQWFHVQPVLPHVVLHAPLMAIVHEEEFLLNLVVNAEVAFARYLKNVQRGVIRHLYKG